MYIYHNTRCLPLLRCCCCCCCYLVQPSCCGGAGSRRRRVLLMPPSAPPGRQRRQQAPSQTQTSWSSQKRWGQPWGRPERTVCLLACRVCCTLPCSCLGAASGSAAWEQLPGVCSCEPGHGPAANHPGSSLELLCHYSPGTVQPGDHVSTLLAGLRHSDELCSDLCCQMCLLKGAHVRAEDCVRTSATDPETSCAECVHPLVNVTS